MPEIEKYLQDFGYRTSARRVVPSDVGPMIARLMRVGSISLQTTEKRWLDLDTVTFAVTSCAHVLGVAGLLGIDVLGPFRRIGFEIGPRDYLTLEQGG